MAFDFLSRPVSNEVESGSKLDRKCICCMWFKVGVVSFLVGVAGKRASISSESCLSSSLGSVPGMVSMSNRGSVTT